MVNDPKLWAGLKFTHSGQTTSSDPQGVGETWREGSGENSLKRMLLLSGRGREGLAEEKGRGAHPREG